eukprot:6192831-Pleurochrysis_carterae.AAC.2
MVDYYAKEGYAAHFLCARPRRLPPISTRAHQVLLNAQRITATSPNSAFTRPSDPFVAQLPCHANAVVELSELASSCGCQFQIWSVLSVAALSQARRHEEPLHPAHADARLPACDRRACRQAQRASGRERPRGRAVQMGRGDQRALAPLVLLSRGEELEQPPRPPRTSLLSN